MLTLELFENDDEFAPSQRVKQQIQVDRHPLREYLSFEEFEQLMDQFDLASLYTETSHEAADTYLELLAQIRNLGFDEIFYNIIEDWIQERYGNNRYGVARAEINTALIDDLIRAFRQTWTETKPRITVYHMVDKMSKVSSQMSNFSELEIYNGDDEVYEAKDDLFADPTIRFDQAFNEYNEDELQKMGFAYGDHPEQDVKIINNYISGHQKWRVLRITGGEHDLTLHLDRLSGLRENDDDLFADKPSLKTQIYNIINFMSNDYYDHAEDAGDEEDDDGEVDDMIIISRQLADVADKFKKDVSSGLRAWHTWLDDSTREEVRGEILNNLKIDLQRMHDGLPPINENENDDDMFASMRRTEFLITSMMKKRLERGMDPEDAVWQIADELDMAKYDVIDALPNSLVLDLENKGLWENKNNDDLFADRVGSWVKNIQDVAQYSVDGWLDRAYDPVNPRLIEIGYEGVEAVKEFTKGMESGLRAWYQLDDELRDNIAQSIKDDLEIDFYAMYDSLPVNEESDDDMFADRETAVNVATAVEWVAGHWDQRAEQLNDPVWHTGADMLRNASLQFQRGGMMSGIQALNDVSEEWGWDALGDDLEFYDADVWQLIEPYLDHLEEDVTDKEDELEEPAEPELSADEREANLQKFLSTSHPDTQKRLYRGQRRAPKPDRFVTTKGRETPSFTDDPEVANVYSRQLDWDVVHGPGSTSVPVYLQMNKPLDIRGLGEYFNLLDFVAVLPNVDLSQESIPNGLGYYDLYMMLSDLDELVYKTGAKSEIEASGSEGLYTIRNFEELAGEVINSGEEGDVNQIEYMLSETQLDSFIIADSSDIVRRLEKMGYDGVILSDIFSAGAPYYQGDVNKLQSGAWDDEEKVITAYRPFHQGKIKSAIGNKGTYNTADPDITREDTL